MTIKILNLFAGIGGNRKSWSGGIEVTAIENNESLAKIYKDFYPNDNVVVTDAFEFLLQNYNKFDFIWASPDCPTHSRLRLMGVKNGSYSAKYPDMRLYSLIIFLKHYFKGKWVVENVKPYYKPLVEPTVKISRHYFWSNFEIPVIKVKYGGNIKKGHAKELQEAKGVNIDKYKLEGRRRDSTIRSFIDPEIGQHILNCALRGTK